MQNSTPDGWHYPSVDRTINEQNLSGIEIICPGWEIAPFQLNFKLGFQ
ncbi:hypothetical protein NTGM5_910013 [Candidatus Nitrotoga sp. M5]|nr:hypothetical protein NTGM5_910013 [Candidatus Nitrotoga sp. M5]